MVTHNYSRSAEVRSPVHAEIETAAINALVQVEQFRHRALLRGHVPPPCTPSCSGELLWL
ncbi:hypothetical protein EYF80_007398 [Liparis tanakae]|uniref:Uncharacterized protein n=1 Tax=Liparis tanakae TaxID=230148 RepID=A0A4Z2IXR8_9TELE|nr:hypothetical protein EYF80_007398 [Liparis tanakae]